MKKESEIITQSADGNKYNYNKHNNSLLPITNFTLSFVYFVFGISSFALSIIFFPTLNATWSDNLWKHLAPLAVSASTITIFLSIFGIRIFSANATSKRTLLSYMVISLLCSLFAWATGIFASIGANVQREKDSILNCNNELIGVFNIWNNIDIYLHYADSIYCSDSCRCHMNTDTIKSFKENVSTLHVLDAWKYEENTYDSNNVSSFTFKDCPQFAKDEVNSRYTEHIKRYRNNNNNWFDENKFAKYWEYIERKFECSGWCEVKYSDPYTLKEKQMYKYIYRDINNGIVKHLGCVHRIMKWVPKMLGAFSGCILICAFLQAVTFVLTIVIYTKSPYVSNRLFERGRLNSLDNV